MKKNKDINQKDFERIEAFLLGKLSENHSRDFLEEIEQDPALKAEVDTQREMMLAVETAEMKNQLDGIHDKTLRKSTSSRWYWLAASILIMVSVGIWMINSPSKTDRIFSEYMFTEHGLPTPMSATNNYVFYDAMVDFKSGKYDLAIEKWKPLLIESGENDTLNYFVGISYFNKKEFEIALTYFKIVQDNENSVFLGKSELSTALALLKTEQFIQLNQLAKQSTSKYAEQIRELNQKLE